ncbi:MAG: hypothetical protein GXO40_00445, partial [Epsilonproteobacteria bacterium]|nr:hypothetical protein [Campylobacterota bacterium]
MDKLFQKHTITEISKQTKISPIILDKLYHHNFDGISYIKLKGFLKILQSEYPDADFSLLQSKIEELQTTTQEHIAPPPSNNKLTYVIVAILVLVIVVLIYVMQHTNKQEFVDDTNNTPTQNITEQSSATNTTVSVHAASTNTTSPSPSISTPPSAPFVSNADNVSTAQISSEVQPLDVNTTLAIIPQQKLWFQVVNLDTNKSTEHLISRPIDINVSGDLYIKFGHGKERLVYNSQTLFPNSMKIVR